MILNANYNQLAGRKTRIQTAILSDVGSLTNASMSIIGVFISSIMTISCLAYLASISFVLFLITLTIAITGASVYFFSAKANTRYMTQSRKLENKFQANFNAVLNGIREIFIEPKKGKFIYEHKVVPNANESYRYDTTAITGLLNNQITGQILFYILITSVLLYFSVVLKISPANIVSFVFTLIYLLGSIESIMVQLPVLMRAGVAGDHLESLKRELEEANFQNPIPVSNRFIHTFNEINVRQLEYHYSDDDKAFSIGPIDFSIQKGQTVFIYGGNGSGKTTFIHSFLGLRFPSGGDICVNGVIVNESNYAEYKGLFAVVFSDFYLFDEILSEEHQDVAKWNYYMELFEVEKKVSVHDKHFSTVDLSTGQRKRLALITALMEEKPVLVLDEWAADQDPLFRKKFYTEIIPLLNSRGTTILAITHDDKYFDCADKLFKMDEGRLKEETSRQERPGFVAARAI
jgi:cyclic peptide transporter